ncbi:MAG: universal stress protein [Haloglomus sp.]
MVYDRFLVPVDRNETTARAVEWGLSFTERRDISVDFLHVVEDDSRRVPLLTRPAAPSQTVSEFPEEFERLVSGAGDRASRHVVTGVPQEEIIRFAVENGADLIVMGQDSKTGINSRLFESVADKVIRTAPVPVLAVPDVDGTCRLDQLLVPVTTGISSENAIAHAAAVADEFGATIHVVNVVDVQRAGGPFNAGGVSKSFVERLKRDARPAVDEALDQFSDLGVDTPIESTVITGSHHEAIDEYVTTNDIDLVVAGRYAESRIKRRVLGHATEHVLNAIDVPLLVVPNDPRA